MSRLLKSIFKQSTINKYYHLPKALLANIIHGFPSDKLVVIGVTGTDGKTTTVNMIYEVLKTAGKKVSMISTINAVIGGKVYDTGFHVTSPDPFMVQKFAKMAVLNKDQYLVLEVTSHAIDQFRFLGIKFNIGVITNITHDHLDYHKTLENYKNIKLKLIKNVKFAIVNDSLDITKGIESRKITFGLTKGDFTQTDLKLNLKIPGEYNIENALAAMAVGFVLNINKEVAKRAVEDFRGLKGRMEEVKNNIGVKIFIDFAHTPNGLENALKSLSKQFKESRIISVFGAAGSRDKLKRPIMGGISAKIADITILTDEDPRFEDSTKIIEEIEAGAIKLGAKEGENLFKQPDRSKAIQYAISLAKKGDVVCIFGKGHESSMNYRGKELPWSDYKEIEKIVKK